MNILDVIDNWLIFKEIAKTKVSNSYIAKKYPQVSKAIKLLELKKVQKIIKGYPDTILIIADEKIMRIPMDKLSLERCRVNECMLKNLERTSIASFVPKFINEVDLQKQICFCETRLSGLGLSAYISRTEQMVLKASDFITKFHMDTGKDIILNSDNFDKLISNDLNRLSFYLSDDNKRKLVKIKQGLEQQLLGKQFKTVWFHGDYKLENILFNTKSWDIEGVIDWDLSLEKGLPLLDIFFLFIYKDSMMTKKSVANIFKDKFLKLEFNDVEKEIIRKYLNAIKISDELIKPLLIVFWINHLMQRCRAVFVSGPASKEWLKENVYEIIDAMRLLQ